MSAYLSDACCECERHIVAPDVNAFSPNNIASCHVRDEDTFVHDTPNPSPQNSVYSNQSQIAKNKVVVSPFPSSKGYSSPQK